MQPRPISLKVEDLRTTNAGMTRCISLAKLRSKVRRPDRSAGRNRHRKNVAGAGHSQFVGPRARSFHLFQCFCHERYVARESTLWSRKRRLYWGAASGQRKI